MSSFLSVLRPLAGTSKAQLEKEDAITLKMATLIVDTISCAKTMLVRSTYTKR